MQLNLNLNENIRMPLPAEIKKNKKTRRYLGTKWRACGADSVTWMKEECNYIPVSMYMQHYILRANVLRAVQMFWVC